MILYSYLYSRMMTHHNVKGYLEPTCSLHSFSILFWEFRGVIMTSKRPFIWHWHGREKRKERTNLRPTEKVFFFNTIGISCSALSHFQGFFAFQYRMGTEWGGRRGANSAPNMEKYCKKELMDKCKRGAIILDPFSTSALVLLSMFSREHSYSNCIFNAQKPNEARPLKQNF